MTKPKASALSLTPGPGVSYTPERRRLSGLTANPRNSRTHSPEQIEQIRASIRTFGWVPSLLVDERDVILAGHGRQLAGIAEGLDEVAVIVGRGLSEQQKRAYLIADNRIAELAGWNDDVLRFELQDLQLQGFDITLTGFDVDFLTQQGGDGPNVGSLAEQFGVPPFSVLTAREGWWQDRKRAWLALGIQSELGRGENAGAANAIPGGSHWPTVNPATGKIARSDSRGRLIPGTDAGSKAAPA